MSSARRLLLVAPIVLLGLTIPLFRHLHAKAQGPNDFERFEAADGSYSFQYPEDWYLINEFGIVVLGNAETTFLVEGELEEGHIEIIFIAPEQLRTVIGIESHGSPNAAMDSYIDSTSGGNIITYGDLEGVIVGETVGVRVFVSDFEVEGWVYMIDAGNDTVMMVLVVTPLDEYDEHEAIVSEIFDTLRFDRINPEATPDIEATVRINLDASSTANSRQVVTPTPFPTLDSNGSQNPVSMTATAVAEMFVASLVPSPTAAELPDTGLFDDQPTVVDRTPAAPVIVVTMVPPAVDGPDFEATIVALESTIAVLETDATTVTAGETSTNTNGCEMVVVQEGDNLISIATQFDVSLNEIIVLNDLGNGAALEVGRELLIPSETCRPDEIAALTDTPSIDRTPRPTAITLSEIEIRAIEGAGDLSTEYVELYNAGRTLNLTGWTLEDEDGHVFEFPRFVIFANSQVSIYSRIGRDRPSELYLNASEAIWEDGEIATLLDADGNVAATFIVDEE